MELLPHKGPTGLPQVQKTGLEFGSARLSFLKEMTPYNIALLPNDPLNENCAVYDVIDRCQKLGVL